MSDFSSAPVTPDAAATFRDMMTARGIPADQIESTLSKHGVAPTSPTPVPSDPAAVPATSAPSHSIYSSAQVAGARATWIAQGLPAAQFDAAAAAEGHTTNTAPATDPTQDMPSSPAGYMLSGAYLQAVGDLSELSEVDAATRAGLFAMNWPQATAKSFVEDVIGSATNGYNSQPEASRQQWAQNELGRAVRATGAPSVEVLLSTCKTVTDRLPRDVAEGWRDASIVDSAPVLAALYHQGLALKRGGR